MRESYQTEIENRIITYKSGYAFTAIDFSDICDSETVNRALSRLCESCFIRRVIQGVYDKPAYSSILEEYESPNIEEVARALSRKFNWNIAPAKETALNQLHLSTQMPNEWSFISDGPYRKYDVEPFTIEFIHCANKEISGRSYITATLIQALKYIGKDKIEEEDIKRLSSSLDSECKATILRESATATSWIRKVIKEVCA